MSEPGQRPRLGAVVLTGGGGARMGGVDKASIEVGGVTLLERALAATMSALEVVVVGEQMPTSRPVTWAREDPAGGGPAAGLLTGLGRFLVPPELVCVLAVDMPRVNPTTMARLSGVVAADPSADAAVLVADGRRQTLAGVYRYSSLVAARPENPEHERGMAIRTLIEPLRIVEVPAVGDEAHDIDTWKDLLGLGE